MCCYAVVDPGVSKWGGGTTRDKHIQLFLNALFLSYNDIKLTFVVAVKDIWQLQPHWLHPHKVCDLGRSVGKIMFTRNRKTVGVVSYTMLH